MIKVLLWDIDGTLLSFKESEKYALKECFNKYHLGHLSDEMIQRYSVINHGYWNKLEKGMITKQDVLVNRFKDFFSSENIDCQDVEGFNDLYQVKLGDTIVFNNDGYELVKELKTKFPQYAVTNGTFVAQERKLKKSGLDQLFDKIFISEEVGYEKPNIKFFEKVKESLKYYRDDEIMIIGDSLTSDIQGGNNANIVCCWYNPTSEENKSTCRIDYEIKDLQELRDILKGE